ncbi:MAG: NAD regulator [Caulobacteraceae bacterium]
MSDAGYAIELSAVIVAATHGRPRVLTVRDGEAIPSGQFQPEHRTLELGLRAWVEASTHHPLGYVEQLYTFADRDRVTGADTPTIALSYLALTREAEGERDSGVAWRDWYLYFPWEDRRDESADTVAEVIAPRLHAWAAEAADAETRRIRRLRAELMFGLEGAPWNEEAALQRYELLYEAGLIPEAARARPLSPDRLLPNPGKPMIHDHRRILATGLSRLRAKIKYRPVVFELMPPVFTLLQLQQAVEALAGRRLHKQNFRRLVESQGLIEETGEQLADTGGRPARLVRFRREVLLQRAAAGTRLSLSRAG